MMSVCLNQIDETHHETSNSKVIRFQKQKGYGCSLARRIAVLPARDLP